MATTAQQISELQEAARQNSSATIELAEKLKTAVEAIEAGAMAQERALRQLRIACLLAIVLAGLALAVSLALLV